MEMKMKVLVLGGTQHVGRALVRTALERGDQVTTLNRGKTRSPEAGVQSLIADRRDLDSVRAAIGDQEWDAVLDTWALAPRVVLDSARLLAGRVGHYGYVSSYAVYQMPWPAGLHEKSPLVDAEPGSEDDADYPAAKRGGELAVLQEFDGPSLFARCGQIVGPYEDLRRTTLWLNRFAQGGPVLVPGPAAKPMALIDARDIAAWMLRAAEDGVAGAFNTSPPSNNTTVEQLFRTMIEVVGSDAELVWADPELLDAEGSWLGAELGLRFPGVPVAPFDQLEVNADAAYQAGLRCRDLRATLADTWEWLQAEGEPPLPHLFPGMPEIDPAIDQRILERLIAESTPKPPTE
jgi:nucleoside-diphosphate-sugar epimerase